MGHCLTLISDLESYQFKAVHTEAHVCDSNMTLSVTKLKPYLIHIELVIFTVQIIVF